MDWKRSKHWKCVHIPLETKVASTVSVDTHPPLTTTFFIYRVSLALLIKSYLPTDDYINLQGSRTRTRDNLKDNVSVKPILWIQYLKVLKTILEPLKIRIIL